MSVFKPINKSEVQVRPTRVNRGQTLHTGSDGWTHQNFCSSSFNDDSNYLNEDKYNFYNSLFVNFYSSASYTSTYKYSPYHSLADTRLSKVTHLNKFYQSGSCFSIPQKYFGEKIKPGTVVITDKDKTDLAGNNLTIQDDGNGNLYSATAHHSQSATTSISSSENYIGNVFYDFGLIVLTETASWSGSVNYTDIVGDDIELKFNSTQTVYVREYSVTIKAKDFNRTMNPMIRGFRSGSNNVKLHTDTSVVYNDYSESTWRPYFNQINLYDEKTGEPLVTAKLPRPVRVRNDMNITYKLRLDI
tara:strand:- start:17 stop:922 length:906 start_codon:yes stop_codon:yes gene_type:complete